MALNAAAPSHTQVRAPHLLGLTNKPCQLKRLVQFQKRQTTLSLPSVKIFPRSQADLSCRVRVRGSLRFAASVATVGQVTEVDKDTFWPIVEAAGDKLVVLDMYTQWCGPCKLIAPKIEDLSQKQTDVVFLKLDCNQENKPLAKELGVKVVPTFKLLKNKKIVKEVTGAKFDELVNALETVKSSS